MLCSLLCLLTLAGTLTVSPARLVTGKYPSSSAMIAKGGAADACGTGRVAAVIVAAIVAVFWSTDLRL